ncbi:MAG: AAA family ATPase [Fusobacterium sp.]|uniref:AAA family ATPase n=1 Tax=Fusobacterium sp. TaxID=68766 RepID=UPI0026DB3D49|nr:AAA family ATPase [Fusobacterium sp.]MDO4689741.1 AAA family ATPase [Fusobacterium sp.]
MEENTKQNKKIKKERIKKLIENLSENLQEREKIIAPTLLATLIDESIFFYGPPGTGKSLIARRMSEVFHNQIYFEYLLHKFSTPDEIFGQVSIAELKKDNYKRLTEGFLPTATFAFLDEIWKSSPAILNTLLTILNEKTFKNGNVVEKVPLRVIIAASNEVPSVNQGLEALYDRFLLRIFVLPIIKKDNFKNLINSKLVKSKINIPEELKIDLAEIKKWKEEIEDVKITEETLNIIWILRDAFQKQFQELGNYISDRRWKKIAYLLKASAYFCDRGSTNLTDLLLLKHCLWTTEDNKVKIDRVIEDTIRDNSYTLTDNLLIFDKKIEKLEKEITYKLYYTEDVYETEHINGKEYFKVKRKETASSKDFEFYISKDYMKSKNNFNPVDKNGIILNGISCNFTSPNSCNIRTFINNSWQEKEKFRPLILHYRGNKRKDIDENLKKELKTAALELKEKCEKLLDSTNLYLENYKIEMDNPFVTERELKIPIEGINKLIDDIKLRKLNCERLEALI